MTQRLYEQICRDAFVQSFSELACKYGYSDTTIANIFDEYATELEKKCGPIIASRVLGIDKKHIVHMMRVVFVDIESGTILEMRPHKKTDIIDSIEKMVDYDKNIQIVTMDTTDGLNQFIEKINRQ